MKIALPIIALSVLWLGGCVSSSTYDAKVAELEACQTGRLKMQDKAKSELDDQFTEMQKLGTDLEARDQALANRERDIAARNREIEMCRRAAAAANEYNERLKQRESDLRGRLQKELSDKDVEISRLRDQLSVRVMDKILFKTGRADIQPAGQAVLQKLATVLKDTDDMIRVEGHTDNVPIGAQLKEKYVSNWELSGARAASVVRFFQDSDSHIDPLRLEPVGFGEYRPVAPNDNDANKQRNRRVEIVLTARKPAPAASDESPATAAPAAAPKN
jgi:chemotaxis protein MotB